MARTRKLKFNRRFVVKYSIIVVKKGLFIAFEGIDGSGKSTQAKLITHRLSSIGASVHHTFEPTSNEIGAIIRKIIKGEQDAHQLTIASLFASDRLDHLLNEDYGMIKHLDQGTHVISDRYYLSSYAYHSVHVDMDWVIQINAMSALLRRSDITFYIDLPAETAVQRMNISRDQVDIYESLENLKKVRENYLIAIDKIKDKENIMLLNGDTTEQSLADQIWEIVNHNL